MKRTRIIILPLGILLLVFAITSYAQNKAQINYHFCAMNGTCFNQPPDWKARIETEEFDAYDKLSQTIDFMTNHPGFILMDSASRRYNCHGYAYSLFQGGDTLFIDWDDKLCSFNGAVIESFIQINESDVQPGDIITAVDSTVYPYTSPHSFIVVNEDTVISKFHNTPLVKHYKYDSYIANTLGLGTVFPYVYYRRIINTNSMVSGPSSINGSGTYTFTPNVTPTNCTWSVEPADMFLVSSGSGYTANLSYKTPIVYLAPKATLTFTFSYGCANHYTATKEIDLYIPTTTISGTAISDGFVIDANAVVTVTGTILSNKNARVIVPVGTRLILNGGTMTDNGNGMWSGIEVWGDKSTHQYEINGIYGQGYLELKNGAVIENAKCAVELWRPGYWNTTGGIIHATDATFRNNAKAVHALHYTNFFNGVKTSYNSYFRNCTFTIDEDYIGTETFFKHVDLSRIKGVDFKGCSFSANRNVSGVWPFCVGIGAYSASFGVDSYCESLYVITCPEEDMIRPSFHGFYQGIHASDDGGGACSFNIKNSVFDNNTCGIYALNSGYGTIVGNDFTVDCSWTCNFGIYTDETANFCIEDNTFHAKAANAGPTYGIEVVNSEGSNDIYHNDFNGLRCGNVALGEHRHESTARRHLHDARHYGRRNGLFGQGGEGVMT